MKSRYPEPPEGSYGSQDDRSYMWPDLGDSERNHRYGTHIVQMYGAPSPPAPFDWIPGLVPHTPAPSTVTLPLSSRGIPVTDVKKTLDALMKIRTDAHTAKDHIPILDELIGYFLSVKS